MKERISVLIAVSSDSPFIEATLDSLSTCKLPEGDLSILIIENGDKKELEEKILRFSDRLPIKYAFTPNRGKSAALNDAIEKHLDPECFIIFTDDDVRFQENWLLKYEQAFRRWGPGHFYGASFGVDYEVEPLPEWKKQLPMSAVGADDEYFSSGGKMNFVGFNWAATKGDLSRAGLFNEDYGPGSKTGATGQETYMQNRLREKGIERIFVPDNPVWHRVPKNKCSPDWAKERAKRMGVEQYLKTQNRLRWVRSKSGSLLAGLFRCLSGSREGRVAVTVDWIKLKSFLGCWWRDRSPDS